LMMLGAVTLFLYKLNAGAGLEVARTMAVNTIVLCEVVYLLNSRRLRETILTREGVFGNPYALLTMMAAVAIQLVYVYWPPMHSLFGAAALTTEEWLLTLGAALILFFAIEAEKPLMQRVRPRAPAPGSGRRVGGAGTAD